MPSMLARDHRGDLRRWDPNPVHAGDMQDAVAAGHALPHQIDARDLAFEELTTEFAQCGRLRGHADEREDLITRSRSLPTTRAPMNPVAPVTNARTAVTVSVTCAA